MSTCTSSLNLERLPKIPVKKGLLWGTGASLLLSGCGAVKDSKAPTVQDRDLRLQRSLQWKEGRFRNPEPMKSNDIKALLSLINGSPHKEPALEVPVHRGDAKQYQTPPASGLRVTWFGHSSSLLEIDGSRVLIDPVWSKRSSPVPFAGPKRYYDPVLELDELPKIDVVAITHDHFDHLDEPTIKHIAKWDARFVVPLGLGAYLEKWGVPSARITELDWWEQVDVGPLRIVSTPARHASGRGLLDRDKTLWCGYAFLGFKHRVYNSGDTGMMSLFSEIGKRLGPFDLTLFDTGQYAAEWPDWHMGPEQAVEAHRLVRGRVFLPVHWGLFTLSTHTWTEPIERCVEAAKENHIDILTPRPGEAMEPTAHTHTSKAWWPSLPWRKAKEYPIHSTGLPEKTKPDMDPGKLSARVGTAVPGYEVRHLQTQLRDRAFEFEQMGNPEAADLANQVAEELGEILSRADQLRASA